MTIWNPTAINPNLPIYLSIADALGEDIDAGKVRPGDRLPTHRDLTPCRNRSCNIAAIPTSAVQRQLHGSHQGRVVAPFEPTDT